MSAADRDSAAAPRSGSGHQVIAWALRLLVAAALVVDAVVHHRQAANYQLAAPGGIGEGNLFRIEAAVAILAALYVVVRGSRPAYVVAFLVAASALGAVLLYRYVQVPAFGPLPSMYEPIWFFQKTLSAYAEAAGVVLAAIGLGWTFGRSRTSAGHSAERSRDRRSVVG